MEHLKTRIKRTPKDYSLAFKLQIINEIEKGILTITQAHRKYGIQGNSTALKWLRQHGRLDWKKGASMKKQVTANITIQELEKKIKRLEQEKEVLNIAIDVADEMFGIEIRKKPYALSLEKFKQQSQKGKA